MVLRTIRNFLSVLTVGLLLATVGVMPRAAQGSDPRVSAAPSDPPASASGQEHGGAVATKEADGHGEKPSLLHWDFGSAFWSIIVFVILLTVLRATAWKPILAAMQKREEFIRDALAEAKQTRLESEAALKKYTDLLNQARAEATAIADEGRRDGEVLKRQIEDTAKAEAASMIDRARREIGVATETAIKELYTASAKLATAAASRVIEKELDATHHEKLIRDSIAELSKSFARPVGSGTVADRR